VGEAHRLVLAARDADGGSAPFALDTRHVSALAETGIVDAAGGLVRAAGSVLE